MKAGIDYKFRDDLFDAKTEGATIPIEVLLDPYQKVVYRYTNVSFKVDEDEVPRMQFAFEVMDPGKYSITTLHKDEFFTRNVGLILNAMLLEVGETDESRTDNLEEPDQE